MKIILASNSPRRKELLTQVGIDFEVKASDIDEVTDKKAPEEVVMDLSKNKALSIYKTNPNRIVLAADTVVAHKGRILGKPIDKDDALRMLNDLSNDTHQVFTGVTIVNTDGSLINFYEKTEVEMYDNSEDVLRTYINTGEPMDKAGAYGIQGKGAVLVKQICGDYNNVVGLPVAKVYRELAKIGALE